MMLTAMGENNNKILGLKTGADDYLSKPFEPEELYLRIVNLLKLYDNINETESKVSFCKYIYYKKSNALKIHNKEVYLTEGENNLLLKLIVKKNSINKFINILIAVSENPKILNVTSLQLTFFTCNCFNNSSLEIISEVFFNAQTADSSKKCCSIPK